MTEDNYYISNINDILYCCTNAIDLINSEVTNHHQIVAYLAYNLADALQLTIEQKRSLIIASFMHDVGAVALYDKFISFEDDDADINTHAFVGAELFTEFLLFNNVSKIIKFHHIPWNNGAGKSYQNEEVPFLSHIVHLADRVAVRINQESCIISQIKPIQEYVKNKSGSLFAPEIADAFLRISSKEALWLDLTYQISVINITDDLALGKYKLTMDEVIDLTMIISRIIDFRSTFTAMHSTGVAAVAVGLAELAGFSGDECKKMHIAGNLHDIGKLAIPREILEKKGRLEPFEYDIIRSHSYYTYRLLKQVSGFEEIAQWAAFHHEQLNGRGYPFHLKANSLSLGARIMAVADVFTALVEDRPYREGMSKDMAVKILREMADNGGLSPSVCRLLIDNYDLVSSFRKSAAEKAVTNYGRLIKN